MNVTDFEVLNHGVCHSQYFQGCGVSFSRYNYVVTGIGDSEREALDDCLEQMATMADIDVAEFEKMAIKEYGGVSTEPENLCVDDDETCEDCDCELYLFMSIRFNTDEPIMGSDK
jgi:hypothetical protein